VTTLRDAVIASGGLCNITDLAERWGMTKQAARWHVRKDWFPEPILTEGGAELWPAHEADDAFYAHRRTYA